MTVRLLGDDKDDCEMTERWLMVDCNVTLKLLLYDYDMTVR